MTYHLIMTLMDNEENIIKHKSMTFENSEKAMEYFRLGTSLYEMVIGR